MDLDAFIGEWTIEAGFPGAPPGTTTFEWILGGKFILERSEVPVPEAPDGLMIIGFDEGLDGNVWTLSRTEPDFAPLDFSQRYVGTFSDDGRAIEGAWEINHDGTTWEKDFDLNYRKR